MNKNFVRLEFYETYYYANIINNIIADPCPYIRGIHEWYEDQEDEIFLPAFPKFSRLHSFAVHIIDSLIAEQISWDESELVSKNPTRDLWVDRALKYHGFHCDGFSAWLNEFGIDRSDVNEDDLADYHRDMRLAGELEELVEHLAREVFHVLFANRKLLSLFNKFLAHVFQGHYDEEPPPDSGSPFRSVGVLKRVNIPAWVKRAVFYRDRGMCSLCRQDLSGTVSSQSDLEYDHIIPLSAGGLNDVTNIQLLCQKCNASKSGSLVAVSTIYESWY